MKVIVVIPAYNEEGKIGKVVKEIKKLNFPVFVVDNNSTDNTAKEAMENGASVIYCKEQGKGNAILKAVKVLNLKFPDNKWYLFLDGDGQHLPRNAFNFIGLAKYFKDIEVFIGDRMWQEKEIPLVRRITNKIISALVSWLCKQKIPDTQCGYRLIAKESFEGLNFVYKDFRFETEFIIKYCKQRKKQIYSVPIDVIYPKNYKNKLVFKDGLKILGLVLKEAINDIREKIRRKSQHYIPKY